MARQSPVLTEVVAQWYKSFMYHHAVGAAVGHHIVKDFQLFVGKVLGVQGSSDPDTDCLGRNLFQQRVPVVQVTSWDSQPGLALHQQYLPALHEQPSQLQSLHWKAS